MLKDQSKRTNRIQRTHGATGIKGTNRTGGTITFSEALSEADTVLARRARKALARVPLSAMPEQLHLADLPEEVILPKSLMPLIAQMLEAVGRGERVRLLSESHEVTPQQAAQILGISRPFFMQILKQGTISSRRVGSHYRVALQDVLSYQQERKRRGDLLDQLAEQAQELDMGY